MYQTRIYKFHFCPNIIVTVGILKTITHYCSSRSSHLVRTEDGHIIDSELSEDIWKNVKRIGAEQVNNYERIGGIETGNSLLDYLHIRFNHEVDQLGADKQKMALSVYQSALNYSSFHEGDDISQVSPSCMGPEHFNGGDVKIPGGYINIFKALTNKFNESTLKLHSVVNKIYFDQESGAVLIQYSNNKKDVEVCCKFVILTVSVGVLKKRHISLFEPQLPVEKVTAINRIGFGNVEKIFLYYNTPFWEQGEGSFKLAWHTGRYDQQELPSWYKCIFGFEEVLDNPNVLAAWVSGSGARTMTSLTDTEVIDICTSLLRSFLADQNIPTPTNMLRSCWSKNESFLGSYTYMNSDHFLDDVTSISQPVFDSLSVPRMLFAGEATHEYYGTTHGALLSGRREAKRVLDFI